MKQTYTLGSVNNSSTPKNSDIGELSNLLTAYLNPQTDDLKMSSREIAELTGKTHRHVLRDIEVLNENYEKVGLPKVG